MVQERQLHWEDDRESESARSYRGQYVFDFALESRLVPAPADFYGLNAEYGSMPARTPRGRPDRNMLLHWDESAAE